MSCAHCVLSSIGIGSSLLTSSTTKLTVAPSYQSNVNFIRRNNANPNQPNTPNSRAKPLHSLEFRSVQPKKRNSIDYTESANAKVAKKLTFSPVATKQMEPDQDQLHETSASKRFLIECFDATAVPLRWRDIDPASAGERFARIYEKCWQQTGSERPSSKRLSAIFGAFLRKHVR